MLERLLHALIESKNESADDVLVEALRLGSPEEKVPVFRRASCYGRRCGSLCGIIEQFDNLPEPLQQQVLKEIKVFHPAIREAGRSDNHPLRLAALKLIAMGHQGKLAYILSENLHNSNEVLSKSATEAMVALARWVATETRRLQRGAHVQPPAQAEPEANPSSQAPEGFNPLSEPAAVAGNHATSAGMRNRNQRRPKSSRIILNWWPSAGNRGGGGAGDGCLSRPLWAGPAPRGITACRHSSKQNAPYPAHLQAWRPKRDGASAPTAAVQRACRSISHGGESRATSLAFWRRLFAHRRSAGARCDASQDTLAEGPPASALHAPGEPGDVAGAGFAA